jgi:hypothetical protein
MKNRDKFGITGVLEVFEIRNLDAKCIFYMENPV